MGYFHVGPIENLTFGLGVYIPAGIGAEWNGNDLKMLTGGTSLDWKSRIAVVNISPAVAYKFNDQFSAGLAMNIYYGMLDMDARGSLGQYSESSNGFGYGVTVGLLAKPHEVFSIGATFRTKTNVTMSGSAKNGSASSDFDRDVAWPMWIAGGIAFKPIDHLIVTADVQFSQWSKSEDRFITEFKATGWGKDTMDLEWKDATQIRLGVNYDIDENISLRAGYYFDPAPAPDKTYNINLPSIDFNTVTIGGGYKIDSFVFDAGLEYLIGKDKTIDPGSNPDAMP